MALLLVNLISLIKNYIIPYSNLLKQMKTICITGSVASGKTTLSKKLAKSLSFNYIDVHEIIKKNKIHDGYDRKNKCYIVDTKKLNRFLIKIINNSKNSLIFDSHLSHYLPPKHVDLCIVTICDIDILSKRLKKRKYGKNKIVDNLEAEIFRSCLFESKSKKHNVLVVDTSSKINFTNILKYIKGI